MHEVAMTNILQFVTSTTVRLTVNTQETEVPDRLLID